MSKNIVICCDGTGNEYGENNSNVVKLFRALVKNQDQIAFYDPGVGTMSAPGAISWFERKWTLMLGMAFGYGLSANISDAYIYLMNRYEPGDRIFLFGFSRGAYTVRALAGLLHMCGLLQKGSENLVPYALKLFRQEKPDREELCGGFKRTFSRECPVHFMGVWDTVSSVGWILDQVKMPYTANNPSVAIARHAVSIDERRCFFRQNLFKPDVKAQNLEEVWFAGVHSDIGGGYPEQESGLSKLALEWMGREAVAAGITLNESEWSKVLGHSQTGQGHEAFVSSNPVAIQHESLRGVWWILEFFPGRHWKKAGGDWVRKWSIPLGRHRIIPEKIKIHRSVMVRMQTKNIAYSPKNLPKEYQVVD